MTFRHKEYCCFFICVNVVRSFCSVTWVCRTNTDYIQPPSSSCGELENKVQALEIQVKQLQKLMQQQGSSTFTTIDGIPRDCEEIYGNGTRTNGLYVISPDGKCPFFVYCDMTNGGWTVIQRRIDGKVNFYRPWADYVNGFGDLDGSHWLGLEKIHRLTGDGNQIYFDIENYDGSKEYAHYKVFTVHGAATVYRMNVDAFGYEGTLKELLSYHDNRKFSTYDRDNDASTGNCCKDSLDGGGWWYNDCYRLGNMNGVFGKKELGGTGYYDGGHIEIKTVVIKVKSVNGVC
ncbi:fibrinogen-like protein A isoform X1 [Mercenaria mercenaria]|uniref:fibrinogen-like protein A isoform X1 n=1 Tax=Mercenaria mercenaria TaxID=6596 RepID=UPI00234E7EB7|nr:fibrinogen-like protein A isoform X1 [Mercenaria mercenaria]